MVGLANTAIDLGLFALLNAPLGITGANLVSSSAGMTCSFVANGRYTFGERRSSLRQAAIFLATTGTVLWVVQPLLIHLVLGAVGSVLVAKAAAVVASVAINFLACKHFVWPVSSRIAPATA